MISEDNKVFFKLRVAPSKGDNKHSVVFNGISANDWLRPIGILSKQGQDSIAKVETLTKRPQTANSILVIKQKDQLRGLQKYETLTGQSFNTRSDMYSTVPVSSINSSHVPPTSSLQRPVTAYSIRNVKKGIVLKSRPQTACDSAKASNLDLTIQSVNCHDPSCRPSTQQNKVGNGTLGKIVLKNEFDTIEGIKRSYQARAQSAPACVNRLNSQIKDRTKPNLYWRASSAYHRRNVVHDPGDTMEKKRINHDQRSLLRPLLYSSEGSIKHSAGCPYKCKGCFKACLVSQDYLDQSQHNQPSSWRKQRRIKRGPGFSVEFAIAKSQPLYQSIYNSKGNELDEKTSTESDM